MLKNRNIYVPTFRKNGSFTPIFFTASFKKTLKEMAQETTLDDATFAGVVGVAVHDLNCDENKLRDAFGLTRGAVALWTQQKNLPHPLARPAIVSWIETQM